MKQSSLVRILEGILEMIQYEKLSIRKNNLNSPVLEELVSLSLEWFKEKSCSSYEANDESYYIDKELFIAKDETNIIGYALGTYRNLKDESSYNKIGETAFELDELFVTKEYREKGIGKNLYSFMEEHVRKNSTIIGVVANSSHYSDLLRFYVENLDMEFVYAQLIKKL